MPEFDPGADQDMRAVFDSFRTGVQESMPVLGVESVRVAARRRQRNRLAVAGCAAVALLVTGGVGMFTLAGGIGDPHRNTAAPGTGRAGPAPASAGATGSPSTAPSVGSPDAGIDAPPPGRSSRSVALQLDHDPVPLPSRSHGVYQGPLSMTIRNTGHAPIVRATVELTIPKTMSFAVAGGTSCDAGPCIVREIHDLPPGATQTVTGTLSYGAGGPQKDKPVDRAAVRVTTTDHNGAQAVESHSFTVTLGDDDSTPTPKPSTSSSPSPSPSAVSHGDGDGQEGSASPPVGEVQASPSA